MKKFVNAFDYANTICQEMKRGILLTAAQDGKVNPMTIGWGTIGIQWGRPIFIAFVRVNRYTRQMLDATGEFTVNVPMGEFDSKILGYCGTKSGRDVDKVKELSLTLEEPDKISVPGIAQLPLTLECKVLYQQLQDISILPQDIMDRYYPQNVPSTATGSNQDAHIAYYGEIVSSYIIEK